MKTSPWRTLASKTKYVNPWIRVTEHSVLNPSGNPGIYGTVHFKNLAIGIIPIEPNGDTYLVGQYRYPLKKYSWEIPEGGGELKVSPLQTAKRELQEETGIKAKRFKKILTMHLSNSVTDELALIYLAFDLTHGKSHPEEDEKLQVKRIPLKVAYQMVIKGKITDAMSVAGILRAFELVKDD